MSEYIYQNIGPLSHADAELALNSREPALIAGTLIAMGLHDLDWLWVQKNAMRFLANENEMVVSAAILSLAHTARVNRSLDKAVVVPALQAVAKEPRYAGSVQDALDDIEQFVKGKIKGDILL
jgi:hypothetical protein